MALEISELAIPDVRLIKPKRFGDDRGFFSETYNKRQFHEAGITADFVQDNHSLSAQPGTIRGLHFQAPPFAQSKLVRVLRGVILDVAVDIRKSSPTYGQWVSAELSADNGVQIFVPRGFLHGFTTLVENCEIAYKVDNYYSAECDGSVYWNDADLNIDWGVDPDTAILSAKDEAAQKFLDFQSPFESHYP